MRVASPKRAGIGFSLMVVVLAIVATVAWWMADRAAERQEIVETVPSAATGAVPAEPAPTLSQRLGEALHSENAPTTEADPPQVKDGVSWGRTAGLHRTPDPLRLKASAALVVDQRSGEVLLQKNENAVLPIASLTKLMTALVITDAKLPMGELITITDDDVDRERNSRSRLRVGTSLTRGEALHLALMSSENRAAHALGRTYPGGLEAFVRAMNGKARALGTKDTTYADPTGLSNRNQSTASDVALVAAAAARQPLIRDYSTTPQHDAMLGKRKVRFNNSDSLAKNRRWDIHLQKTGYIVEAGQCLVVNATIAGRNLLFVLLDSADKRSRLDDAERIRHWAMGEAYPPLHPVALREKARKLKHRLAGGSPKRKK